ncbi:replicative DNA helicase [bacterium]|nr:replicative DNA helicase [bacterium]
MAQLEERRSKSALNLPHSLEAEVAVIGAVLTNPSSAIEQTEKLVADYFFVETHRIIVDAMRELLFESVPPDLVNVHEKLRFHNRHQAVGDFEGLRQFMHYGANSENVGYWLDVVKRFWELRLVVEKCSDLATRGRRVAEASVESFLAEAEETFMQLAATRGHTGLTPASVVVRDTIQELNNLMNNPGGMTGVPSGFSDLDTITAGFQPSDLIIVAARPAMGKTSLALNFAQNAAIGFKKNVAIFSLEMSKHQLMQRMLSTAARIEAHRFRDGKMSAEELHRLYPEAVNFQTDHLMIDDTPSISLLDLRSRCRQMKREKRSVDMVIIDYLQLMTVGTNLASKSSREREVGMISQGLKALAKELSCPVIALAQLNRGLEQRPDKRPRSSDLRESGSIEQDADMIMFIYRDEYYHTDSPDKGIAEIIIGKNRHGPTDTVKLAFQSEFTAFHNLAKSY